MTVISGYTELMALSTEKKSREDYSRQVQRQFEIMNGMIRAILAFARGDTELLLTAVPLNLFFDEVNTQLRRALEQQKVELQLEPGCTDTIRVDRVKLLRLVANLANNAAAAMKEGGNFTFRSTREGERVLLEFEDDGPGIPEQLEGRLFDVFATGGGGTGLGLAIVKRIVEQHDGSIAVESQKGQGTRFRVWLPVDGPSASPA